MVHRPHSSIDECGRFYCVLESEEVRGRSARGVVSLEWLDSPLLIYPMFLSAEQAIRF